MSVITEVRFDKQEQLDKIVSGLVTGETVIAVTTAKVPGPGSSA